VTTRGATLGLTGELGETRPHSLYRTACNCASPAPTWFLQGVTVLQKRRHTSDTVKEQPGSALRSAWASPADPLRHGLQRHRQQDARGCRRWPTRAKRQGVRTSSSGIVRGTWSESASTRWPVFLYLDVNRRAG
jgi:hypothetical protein